MASVFKFVIVASILMMACPSCQAQQFSFDGCPGDTRAMTGFDQFKFSGLWYEYERYENPIGDSCVSLTIQRRNNGELQIHTVGKSLIDFHAKEKKIEVARPAGSNNQEAKYELKNRFDMNFIRMFNIPPVANFYVLDTDYTTYSIIWHCESTLGSIQNLQILTRQRRPTPEIVTAINAKLVELRRSAEKLTKVDQSASICG